MELLAEDEEEVEDQEERYNDDSSLSYPPIFDKDSGPAACTHICSIPDDFFRLCSLMS